MKKLVFLFVVFAAVSFASCGNKAAKNQVENAEAACEAVCDSAKECEKACCDSLKAACDSVCCDSVKECCDSVKVAE